jgi:hypothetical protein
MAAREVVADVVGRVTPTRTNLNLVPPLPNTLTYNIPGQLQIIDHDIYHRNNVFHIILICGTRDDLMTEYSQMAVILGSSYLYVFNLYHHLTSVLLRGLSQFPLPCQVAPR